MSSKRDEEDGVLDDSDDDSSSSDDDLNSPPKKRKKVESNTNKRSFIDDAAEESGEDDDDEDEDDEEDDDDNVYVKDGFVVDEEEEVREKKEKGDLEDSDDEDDDDDDDDDDNKKDKTGSARKRLKKISKMRQLDRLDEEDLALIKEAKGEDEEMMPERGPEPPERQRVVARSEAELRKGLFADQADEDENREPRERQPARVERYDEDGMDDFIDDDIGDQGDIMASERRGGLFDDETREVSEAQLNEASEIFGTDYLEFMTEDQPDAEDEELMGKYRESGVGVDLGDDSDVGELSDDDEDDLFGDDDDDQADSLTSQQKKEALRLKREKRRLAKAERRQQALQRKVERRKAQLRRAFEPVQLVENFCTDRDDDIRQKDIPERFYDWKTPFHGSQGEDMSEAEREEAQWIAERIPRIASELSGIGDDGAKKENILESIVYALRFMHKDKLEPTFVRHYRKDYVTSPVVRDILHSIMDEDTEWDQMVGAKTKVESLLDEITLAADSLVSQSADVQKLTNLQNELKAAEQALDETAKKETQIKHELEALGAAEDDDDELFGDEDNDEVGLYRLVGFHSTLRF